MSGAPFRDLFTELPTALFDALKGIAESAIADAERRQAYVSEVNDVIRSYDSAAVARAVCERYGWLRYTMSRSVMHCETEIVVRLPCMHKQVFTLPDQVMEDSPVAVVDYLDLVATSGRPCFCVQQVFAL